MIKIIFSFCLLFVVCCLLFVVCCLLKFTILDPTKAILKLETAEVFVQSQQYDYALQTAQDAIAVFQTEADQNVTMLQGIVKCYLLIAQIYESMIVVIFNQNK